MITIKKFNKNEAMAIVDPILEFYTPKYKHQFTETTVENSAVICIAYDIDRIIGAVRAISDLSRHALIVDMIVEEKYRKQKIGTKLLQSIVDELKRYNVKNIGLTTEPGIDWLPRFYEKNGFEPLDKNSTYMELKY